jgi:Sulfotransferase family
MQVVLATASLQGLAGSETYVVTLADHLQRLGHDVWLHSSEHGRSSAAAERLGVRVARDERELPDEPDVVVVQDGAVACDLAARYPSAPQVFVAHSDVFDLQLPPQLPDLVTVVVTLYDRVERRIRAMALPCEVVRLSQPVDIERFKPVRALPERAGVALTLSNYLHGERLEMLGRACSRADVELRHVGEYASGGAAPAERAFDEADIVFGKARVIYEAMACGRAAYVFDANGGEGWVTAQSYEALSADNFGGQTTAAVVDEDRLVADLEAYDPGMGIVNRDLVVARHSATKHAAAFAELLERVAPRRRDTPVAGPLREVARLVRLYHRADSQAVALHAELQQLSGELHRVKQEADDRQLQAAAGAARLANRVAFLEAERDQLCDELVRTRAEVHAIRAEADAFGASAGQGWKAYNDLVGSRRWRTVQAALRPAELLRRRGRRAPVAEAEPPAPFIVGVPRSGTTLLRFQLDAHPQLAIGAETGFGLVAGDVAARGGGPGDLLDALTAMETWPDLRLERDRAGEVLDRVTPWSVGGGLRALYKELAALDGKPRWGDKTPAHLRRIAALAELLPEAHFVHIVRDGRAVACSVRDLHFAPGDGSIEAIADDWRDQITDARASGAAVTHYHEVRFERLVAEPEATLRELCRFVELEFDPAMLRPHERAEVRLAQLPEVRRFKDRTFTREDRRRMQASTLRPPDPALAESWRDALPPDDVARFEARAGDLLEELGYPLETRR